DGTTTTRGNLGIGGFDLAERAYSTDSRDFQLRAQEAGPVGRRAFANTRLELDFIKTGNHSILEAPTVRVLDGVTTGGAQMAGGRDLRTFELASDVDYVRGMHTVRTGFMLEGGSYRSDESSNYLGTFVFTSTAALSAGAPTRYSRRIGDPLISYANLDAGVYVQDDIKIRKNLTFSPGLRYEAQTHVSDASGFAPRLGLTWAPAKSGRTTIRASYGVFYNWLGTGAYEQSLRVDGFRQRDLNIVNPTFPDPGSAGSVTAVDRYLLGSDLRLERYQRIGIAIDQTVSPMVRTSLSFASMRFDHQLHGVNLNAPNAVGIRPDPTFANVIEAVSEAETRYYQINPSLNVNLAGGVRNAGQPRWNPRRTLIRFDYRYRPTFNNTDGAFVPSPTGTLLTEWAPARNDIRHRVRASMSTQALKNLNAQLNLEASSGAPYTITTGFDDNGDGIFNDRPADVGRDTARLPWRSTLSGNVSYFVGFKGAVAGPGGGGGGGDRERERGAGGPRGVTFTVAIINLTNRDNYIGFSGVMTSQYFLQPTAVANPRQIDFTMRVAF
ncbi:MAG TPA: TonB-dependent receptor, partial [Vicinamibacterales bacterium]|nr:TonB-dependent receptor [Vicinamibacterales bacterium]